MRIFKWLIFLFTLSTFIYVFIADIKIGREREKFLLEYFKKYGREPEYYKNDLYDFGGNKYPNEFVKIDSALFTSSLSDNKKLEVIENRRRSIENALTIFGIINTLFIALYLYNNYQRMKDKAREKRGEKPEELGFLEKKKG